MICSHFSIFGTLETTKETEKTSAETLWFALILVSLEHWKQHYARVYYVRAVVICSHFSIFGTLETTGDDPKTLPPELWFALILVSLEHWKQPSECLCPQYLVVICSHFSIFGTLETTSEVQVLRVPTLWFALILVSLEHWKQQ